MNEKLTLKTRDVAALLGVSPRTVSRWWQRGENGFPSPDLPGNGDRWHRWTRKTILDWVDRRSRKVA